MDFLTSQNLKTLQIILLIISVIYVSWELLDKINTRILKKDN